MMRRLWVLSLVVRGDIFTRKMEMVVRGDIFTRKMEMVV